MSQSREPSCGGLVLCRRTGAPASRFDAGDISTPAPLLPALSRGEKRVSQVPGPSSSCVPWSTTPPGAPTPRPFSVWSLLPSGFPKPWAPGKVPSFEAAWPTAHAFACLRFAESVTVPGARLATDRAGSPVAGRASHPLDDIQGFMGSSHLPIPLHQPCLVAPGIPVKCSRNHRQVRRNPQTWRNSRRPAGRRGLRTSNRRLAFNCPDRSQCHEFADSHETRLTD